VNPTALRLPDPRTGLPHDEHTIEQTCTTAGPAVVEPFRIVTGTQIFAHSAGNPPFQRCGIDRRCNATVPQHSKMCQGTVAGTVSVGGTSVPVQTGHPSLTERFMSARRAWEVAFGYQSLQSETLENQLPPLYCASSSSRVSCRCSSSAAFALSRSLVIVHPSTAKMHVPIIAEPTMIAFDCCIGFVTHC
jgi:hypothetical protein